MMDWKLFFSAAGFGVMLTMSVSSATFFIIRLMIQPLKEDVADMKKTLTHVKSEGELDNMIKLEVARHKERCVPEIRELVEKQCA